MKSRSLSLYRTLAATLLTAGVALLPILSARAANWALLIGIDNYADGAETTGRIAPLAGAVNDANALAAVLTERAGFPKENVFVLTSNGMVKPTRAEILDKLATLSERVNAGDTVFVFYAGHGCFDAVTNKDYLLPYDTKIKTISLLKNTALDTDTFLESLHTLPAKLLIVAFDKCRIEIGRGGSVTEPDAAQKTRGLDFVRSGTPIKTDILESSPQVVVKWFACNPGQRSYEWHDKNRGYFSYFLEQGFKGMGTANGKAVTLADLTRYVGPAVEQKVLQIEGQSQRPRLLLDNVGTPDELATFVLATGTNVPFAPPKTDATFGGEGVRAGTRGGDTGLEAGTGATRRVNGGDGAVDGPGGSEGGPIGRKSGVGPGVGAGNAGTFGVKNGASNGDDTIGKTGRVAIAVKASGGGADIRSTRLGTQEKVGDDHNLAVTDGGKKFQRTTGAADGGGDLDTRLNTATHYTALTEARLLSHGKPVITDEQRAAGLKSVKVEFKVAADGSCIYRIVSGSGNSEVDDAVLKACSKFRWSPAKYGDQPESSTRYIVFNPNE